MKFAVLGSPIAHSKSPKLHGAAYRALGMDHTYETLETTEAELPARLEALRRGEWDGFNVTVPLKQHVLALVDDADPVARAVGAANTLVRRGDRIAAYNTDVDALAQEIRALAEKPFPGRTTGLVLGTGGAARAAIAALGIVGCRRVVVLGRAIHTRDVAGAEATLRFQTDAERILASAAPSPNALATTSVVVRPLDGPWGPPDEVRVVVQATTCGMTGGPPGSIVADAIEWDALPDDAVAIDAVYAPPETPFLARARARGLRSANGLGMLARQGAKAFSLWLGVDPPLDVMRDAIAS